MAFTRLLRSITLGRSWHHSIYACRARGASSYGADPRSQVRDASSSVRRRNGSISSRNTTYIGANLSMQ